MLGTDDLKTLSSDLSAHLKSEENIQGVIRVVNQAKTFFSDRADVIQPRHFNSSSSESLRPPEVRTVGIWEPRVEKGQVSFVRVRNKHLWMGWADVERIEPKGNKSRVILIGESVAHSTFIAPYFNCATALQILLQSATGTQNVEVVDIARGGMSFHMLNKLLVSALALEPNAYVIFAGNNWQHSTSWRSKLNINKIVSLLRETEKWTPVRNYIEGVLREHIVDFVTYLGRFSSENRLPIIFVIPEFNLLDWQVEGSWRNPLVTSDIVRRSLYNKAQAEKALADGNLYLAAALTEEMIQMEEGSNPGGFEVLARHNLNQGNIAEARRLKEKAIDTGLTFTGIGIPRCFSVVQEVFRQESARHGVTLVDLPRRFEEYLPDTLPGRRFFFDNCHMTVEGIRLAMASTAEQLLPLLGQCERSWSEMNQFQFEVDHFGLAHAHFAAAHVNAQLGQDYEIIRYHCSEAIRQTHEITDLMRLFINTYVRQTNIKYFKELMNFLGEKGILCHSFFRRPNANHVDRYTPARILNEEELQPPLILALTDLLSEIDPEIKRWVDVTLQREHGVPSHDIDLLRRPYMDVIYGQLEYDWQRESVYFKSYRIESSFRLICESPCSIRVNLVCRVPGAANVTEPINLLVNGITSYNLIASADWVAADWVIPANLLHQGMNSLMIRWPEPSQSKRQRVEEVANRIERCVEWQDIKETAFVYGEVYEFRAYADGENGHG
jgi:hypothetical protein